MTRILLPKVLKCRARILPGSGYSMTTIKFSRTQIVFTDFLKLNMYRVYSGVQTDTGR